MTYLRSLVLLVLLSAGVARTARAVDCSTLPNPIYLVGSASLNAPLKVLAGVLAAETTPATLVITTPGTCVGLMTLASAGVETGTATTYDTTGTAQTCTLPAAGQAPDLAVSDVFYESCTGLTPATRPSGLGDFRGPVLPVEIVVPKADTSTTYLTALEAQDIWGCGAAASIATFNMAQEIFCRDASQGPQIVLGGGIGLGAGSFMGTNTNNTNNMVNDVANASAPQSAIGFVGADVYDANRSTLNALAFAASGQTAAYYADATSGTTDRQNVRDGHYYLWGYEHLFAAVGSNNTVTNANAAKVIGLITGASSDPNFDFIRAEGAAGLVPTCAMKVQKTDDSPGYLSTVPAGGDSCTCSYLAAVGTAPATCVACSVSTTCTGGKTCQHGYCE